MSIAQRIAMESHVSANQPSEQIAAPVPIWAPYYGATFSVAVVRFWKKYATFSGRASRSEYWWAVLALVITGGVVDILASIVLASINIAATNTSRLPEIAPWHLIILLLVVLWSVAFIIPSYAIISRRLHDTNRSAWFILVILIPFVGGIVLLVMMIADPNPLGSRFDRPPLAG
jgi:uncharacterized membrane protein YhaH (DUF805 family)